MKKENKNIPQIEDGNAEAILACNDIKLEKFYVKDWNCNIYIKQMSVNDITELRNSIKDMEDDQERNLQTLLVCCCKQDGQRMFKLEHLPRLKDKSLHAMSLIAARINSLIYKSNKDIEEQAKNF